MRRLRIAYFIDSIEEAAGTENQLRELIHRLDKQTFEIFLIALRDGPGLRSLPAVPLVYPVSSLYSLAGVRGLLACARDLRKLDLDLVQTFMMKSTAFGVVAASLAGCGRVLTSRRNLGYRYDRFNVWLFGMLNRLTCRIVANSEGAKKVVADLESVSPTLIDVLYNGVDISRFAGTEGPDCDLRLPPGAEVVGIVANYRPVKDLQLFLRGAALVAKRRPAAVFVLIGEGPLEPELRALADELGIGERVFFVHAGNRVADYLPVIDVACLTSLSEGFSNAILEYMAAGLPTVVTDVGGNREAIEHEKTGFVLSTREPSELADRVFTLLEDKELRRQAGERGRDRCRALFSFEACVRNTEAYYRSVIDRC